MLLKNPYELDLLSLINHTETIANINRYIVTEYGYLQHNQLFKPKEFITSNNVVKPVILYGTTTIEEDIPPFDHPLYNEKNNWLAVDLRTVVKREPGSSQVTVRNISDYSLMTSKYMLSGLWMCDKQIEMYSYKLPHMAYAEWLSTNISKKFGLGPGEQLQIFLLASIYYINLFTNGYTEEDIQKLRIRLKNELFVDSMLDDVLAKCSGIQDLDAFCTACYTVTNSPRVKGLNTAIMYNLIANNWFSVGGNQLAILALHHPPTWIAMCYSAITSKTYRNSYVSKVVESKSKKGSGEEFIKEIETTLKNAVKG